MKISDGSRGPGFSSTDSIYIRGSQPRSFLPFSLPPSSPIPSTPLLPRAALFSALDSSRKPVELVQRDTERGDGKLARGKKPVKEVEDARTEKDTAGSKNGGPRKDETRDSLTWKKAPVPRKLRVQAGRNGERGNQPRPLRRSLYYAKHVFAPPGIYGGRLPRASSLLCTLPPAAFATRPSRRVARGPAEKPT